MQDGFLTLCAGTQALFPRLTHRNPKRKCTEPGNRMEHKKIPRELFLKGDLGDSPSCRRLRLGNVCCVLALSHQGQVFSHLRMLPGSWSFVFLTEFGCFAKQRAWLTWAVPVLSRCIMQAPEDLTGSLRRDYSFWASPVWSTGLSLH